MNKLKGGIILLILFIVAAYSSLFIEEYFRKTIRYLYEYSTNGKISFFFTGKHYFLSEKFAFSFGLFMVIFSFLLYRQTNRKRVIIFFLTILLFIISIVISCYFDASLKLVECTACNGGAKQLHYNDINYDFIFISALFFALIPTLITEIRKQLIK